MHRPGLLPTTVSCARLFARVERTKVSNSSYSRDPRMRLFPAFSSLVHFERKTKLYKRGEFTHIYASPWPIADFCELNASVRMCGEDQGVKSSYSRDPRIRGSLRHLAPSCTSKGTSNIIKGVKLPNVTHSPGLLPSSVSSTRLFACVERTKVSKSNYSRDPCIRGSFQSLAPSCTSKGTSNII